MRNKRLLLGPAPSLNLLLPCNGIGYISKNLMMNQAIHVIAASESWQGLVLVLPNTLCEIARHANL